MRIDIVSVFPEYFAVLDVSLLGRARERGTLGIAVHDPRDFTQDRHRTVDDTPYGGGAGMVMRPEPWGAVLDHVLAQGEAALPAGVVPHLLVPSPAGRPFTQRLAAELAREPWLVL
ncbi:MAG: tRNA (guanosine(37)-N1)-methyltransferase TrmD, partial [Actinomycetota bacterium]|nr:tRNA (guanosine(37)-N1)-methyltransferase TrmD [Actinomycetota bacterium]